MKSFILLSVAALGLCNLASASTTTEQAYVARYAGRTDVPVPVHVVSPTVGRSDYGRVRVGFKVSPQGEVREVAVVASSGTVRDEAIIAALSNWKFQPRQNQAVDVPVELTVNVNVNS